MRAAAICLLLSLSLVSATFAQTATPSDIAQVALATVERLGQSDYPAVMASFSPRLKAALTEKKLRSAWEGVLRKNGAFLKIGETSQRKNGKLRAIAVDTTFTKGRVEVEVVFNDAGEVAGLLFHRR